MYKNNYFKKKTLIFALQRMFLFLKRFIRFNLDLMKQFFYIILILTLFASCRIVNPSIMLRTGCGYNYSKAKIDSNATYIIAEGDILDFNVVSNNGEKLLNPLMEQMSLSKSNNTYKVEFDGTVKLPIIERIKIVGLTERQTDSLLTIQYSKFFNKPFVQVNIINKKVFVFKGGNKSQVVNLQNDNTRLFDVLALSGGIDEGKANKIKLIRRINNKTEVYLVDLSKVKNIEQGNIVMQANDIVYITPRETTAKDILYAITPYITLLSSIALIIALFK